MIESQDVFALPDRLTAKADARLIESDRRHFAAVAASLRNQVEGLTTRLAELRLQPGGRGRAAMDRDLEIHRVSARLRMMRRYRLDVCLGRVVTTEGRVTYIGRIGVGEPGAEPLVIDWRARAAEPFFAATAANPRGVRSRRRYRWVNGQIVDYWDEVLSGGESEGLALDQDSALLASLAATRTSRMRDVLSTIQTDQDAIIRASSSGALVVDGGPGTGKTVAALHRAAYLLYADPRLGAGRGGVLVVGPHEPYLAFVADVLPSLGEEGVQTCTVRDLVPEGAMARKETDPEVARLKASARMVEAVDPAVGLYEEPPTSPMIVETAWVDIPLDAGDWREAFGNVDAGTPHNEARDEVWESLVDIAVDKAPDGVPAAELRRAVAGNEDLRTAFQRAWPILEPTDLVSDLWAVPAYLRRCAPWLSAEEVRALKRPEGSPWTLSDLPLLDAMRRRLGDPEWSLRQRRREASLAADRAYMDDVVDYLLSTDDDPESGLSYLRRDGIRDALVDEGGLEPGPSEGLVGPFAHIVVDEAQELTDAEWQMLLSRCPSQSVTVVGDRAQARRGFAEPWRERLARVGFGRVSEATLTVNYRTPREVMAEAEPVIRAVLPDANVPVSIRSSGVPVRRGAVEELPGIVSDWLGTHAEGIACVIGDPDYPSSDRVWSLTPQTAKGLEFDLVVLVEPKNNRGQTPLVHGASPNLGEGIASAVDSYVSMTRTTQELVVLTRADPRS